MIDALSVAESVHGLAEIGVSSCVVEMLEAVGGLLCLFAADGELLVVLYVAGDKALLEAVVDMVRL